MNFSKCYLSDDFEKFGIENLPSGCILSPEGLKNAKQIEEWVCSLKESPKVFATTSLYLLRELHLQKIQVEYHNNGIESFDVDNIGAIEILDRELEQSDRELERYEKEFQDDIKSVDIEVLERKPEQPDKNIKIG